MSNKIKFITAFPKSAVYYSYYINNNFEDKHLMKRDDFYHFIADLLTSPNMPSKIREYIDRNLYFIVDISANALQELKKDDLVNNEEIKKEKFKNVLKKHNAEKIKQNKKKKKTNFFDDSFKSLYHRFNIK
jgi:hypothetical protein